MYTKFFWLLFVSSLLFSTSTFGQTTAVSKLESELIGSWLVTVEYTPKNRGLKIVGITPRPDGGFSLDAKFGWLDSEQSVSTAEIKQNGKEITLTLTAKSGAKVIAVQEQDGSFFGKFLGTDDSTERVKITKILENNPQTRQSSVFDAYPKVTPTIEKPSSDVPVACAAFFGGWAGRWSNSQGQQRLWVIDIKADCTAKVSYMATKSMKMPSKFQEGTIKEGTITVPCGSGIYSGTCSFERNSEEVWARYSNPSGDNNTAVFKKIQ